MTRVTTMVIVNLCACTFDGVGAERGCVCVCVCENVFVYKLRPTVCRCLLVNPLL